MHLGIVQQILLPIIVPKLKVNPPKHKTFKAASTKR